MEYGDTFRLLKITTIFSNTSLDSFKCMWFIIFTIYSNTFDFFKLWRWIILSNDRKTFFFRQTLKIFLYDFIMYLNNWTQFLFNCRVFIFHDCLKFIKCVWPFISIQTGPFLCQFCWPISITEIGYITVSFCKLYASYFAKSKNKWWLKSSN